MLTPEDVKTEVAARLRPLDLGKTHLSVRYEAGPKMVRIGACVSKYDWSNREAVIDALLEFEDAHADEFAVEFDVVPLEAVTDPQYAEI